MTGELFISFMTSMLICIALIPLLQLLANRFHFMDQPGARKVHQHPVPRVGGIAFAVGACISIAWWAPKDITTLSVFLGGLIILGFGVWDDRVDLGYRTKLLGQVLAALAVVLIGGIRFESIPFRLDAELPLWVSISVTVLFLVGLSNAVNLTDGLDGLAGGLSFLALFGIAYLAHISDNSLVLLLVVPFLGGLLGFLRYNTYPARVFMGDGGSQLLGFMKGVLTILLTDSARGPFSSVLSLFILGLPFLDTLCVSVQRLVEGRSPFVGDRSHIHHKLISAGLSHKEAVKLIYVMQAVMVGLAYLLRWQSDSLIMLLYLILASVGLALFMASTYHLDLNLPAQNAHPRLGQWRVGVIGNYWLCDFPLLLLSVLVQSFLIGTVFIQTTVPSEVSYLSAMLFMIMLAGLSFLHRFALFFVRMGGYLGSTILLYINNEVWMKAAAPIPMLYHVLFEVLAVLVLLTVLFTRQSSFQTTPLDYLIVSLAITVPVLPGMGPAVVGFGPLVAKLIVLFFSFELCLHAFSDQVRRLKLVFLWVLFWLGFKMWL